MGESQHQISGYTACFRFLMAVRRRYPQVLADLATFPLERAKELAEEGEAIQWVRDWARRQGHGLRSDVVLHVAVWTLNEWARNPKARSMRRWEFDHVVWTIPETRLPRLFPDPFRETQASWRKRSDRLWRERVRELKRSGCSEVRFKDQQHFDWLAQYVVGRKTLGQIRHTARAASTQTIADAVHRLANMIGLDLPERSAANRAPQNTNRKLAKK